MVEHETIKSFIQEELLVGREIEVGYDDDLLMSGLVNSLGVMRLVSFTQDTFDVDIPADEITIENFETITAIVNFIKSRSKSE